MSNINNQVTLESAIKKPTIVLPRLVFEKIMHFVQKSHLECSGMGVTEVVGDKIFVRDVIMIKQSNGGASTDIDAEEMARAMYRFREHPGNLNYWWHSHVNMDVFWSGTDTATIKQIAKEGMCIATVFNKKRQQRSAVACLAKLPFADKEEILMLDSCQLDVEPITIPDELKTAWDAEYTQNTVVKSYASTTSMGLGYHDKPTGSYYDKYDDWYQCANGFWRRREWDNYLREREQETKAGDRGLEDSLNEDGKKLESAKTTSLGGETIRNSLRSSGVTSSNFTPPALTDDQKQYLSESRRKWEYAHNDEDIVNYYKLSDQFELLNGLFVDAEQYMKNKEAAIQTSTVEKAYRGNRDY